jgi:hypothetical protein
MDLARVAAAATLIVDLKTPSRSSEAMSMNAGWFMDLIEMRRERKQWLTEMMGEPTTFPLIPEEYRYIRGSGDSEIQEVTCINCPEDVEDQRRYLPLELKARILKFPSPLAIEDIDFCAELQCMWCGAAANTFFGRICREYRERFQDF